MVASRAFRELSAVIDRLESAGAEVQHAALDQDLSGVEDDITTELSLVVPLLSGEALGETVALEADGADVTDGRVEVDLTVTVSVDEDAPTGGIEAGLDTGRAGDTAGSGGTPAYKDPEALQRVYDQYDSFPKMTDALGVDVTAETVRRHMVDLGIHDPATPPQSAVDATTEQSDGTAQASATSPETDQQSEADRTAATPTRDSQRDTASSTDDGPVSGEESAPSAVTDGGSTTVDSVRADGPTPLAATPLTDVLADGETQEEAGSHGSDGVTVPDGVTVGGLAAAINRAKTVREVAKSIGTSQGEARQLLQSFDLIHFVSHPLAAEQVTVSPAEVERRLGASE